MPVATGSFKTDFNSGHMGVVYTPVQAARKLVIEDVRKAIARSATQDGTISILEPCSGYGNLVFALIECLKELNVGPKRARILSNDTDRQALSFQKKRLAKEYPEWVNSVRFTSRDFLLSQKQSERFDIAIMNPPWVGYKGIAPAYAEQLRSLFPFLRGQFDVLDPFVWKVREVLRESGALLAFLPDKVLSSHQPSNCLDVLKEKISIVRTVNLPPKFFPEIQHDSVYLSIKNSAPKKTVRPANNVVGIPLSELFSVFRGIEISGRSSVHLVENKFQAFDPARPFVTGRHIGNTGNLVDVGDQYISKSIPRSLVKKQFDYRGPCILVRKTGAPVSVAYSAQLPLTSQVVFCAVPRNEIALPASFIKSVAEFLMSSQGQKQLSRNSGKLGRSVFPYVTISDLNNVCIPQAMLPTSISKAMKRAA